MPALDLVDCGSRWKKYQLDAGPGAISYRDVLTAWCSEPAFQDQFTRWLAAIEFGAFFFEVRPLLPISLDAAFEFIVAESTQLQGLTATPEPFQDWFTPVDPVVNFPNLGSDAELIAPCPLSPTADYAHLAAFLRTAEPAQTRSLWQVTGQQVLHNCDDKPLWVSTSGLGVAWLHVRLDRVPKYYTHSPYRRL